MSYLLHKLLTNSADRYPEQIAVRYRTEEISYHQLETVSNRLAHTLADLGVERGDRVGIYLEKSIASVIAIFGIMKAGAAYVPLDAFAPKERIAFIMSNCKMKALISTASSVTALNADSADAFSSVRGVILVDHETVPEKAKELQAHTGVIGWSEVLQSPPHSLELALIEDDLAYILYTSGSTGTPKGVMISHRASLTFVDWACDIFQVRATDKVSNHAPLHFDLSTFDIFATIKAGGTVVMVPTALSSFPLSLAPFITKEEITIWYSVPSMLTGLVLHGRLEKHDYSHLRTILFAGEVFPIKYLRQLMEKIPHAEYYNLYGPTETNVCTYYAVPPIDPDRIEPLSIGKGCANSEVLVLDEHYKKVPVGEVGELCVRGPGVMRGYWDMPERTQKALVPCDIPPVVGLHTLYRTGDLVKETLDGNYTYLGRRDNMIKSRGYRIELGEIETVLYSHPELEEVAAIPIPDDEIGNRIKAVVVTRDGKELESGVLESFCAQHLPKYMVPHLFEFRPLLAKTSTGKIDKMQLHRE
uniref:Amino acid adenylation domain-containing protein n=1 Tax=Candidatus Kentrum sp. FW TaxID=2126338 RepID=A0A450SI36_9GAMM|nr:MAG: amino acid adenylation domain-containing protein [Candidatus Kentron sp. FW]VFJ54476.1 MAG: amino acid adenylation domain-containing protein [Candidatus Kentron sp. FW]